MKKSNIVFVICSIVLVVIYLYWLNSNQTENRNEYLENYKKEAQQNFDELYDKNYEVDYELIVQQAEIKKQEEIKQKERELITTYWREAKSKVGQKIGAITQEFPEIYSELVVKDVDNGKYTSIKHYIQDNYPESRLLNYPIIEKCQEYKASKEQCALMLAVAGVESSMDTNYVTHWREKDVQGGQQRNNLWGLKMNRRYADLKGLDYVSKPPYDNYSFVAFTTLDSGIKYFLEFLKIEYKGASRPLHLYPYFNGSSTWLQKTERFYEIILPLIKY